MPRVTVIVPTFDHQETLNYSLAGLQAQTFQDFDVVVIGDGAPPATQEIVAGFSQQDARFRYIHKPKSPRTGEPYRNELIRSIYSDIIAYMGDDDICFPWHLENLVQALETADFAYSPHILVNLSGQLSGFLFSAESPVLREAMRKIRIQSFGPTYVAHKRDSYLKLRKGWDSAPWGVNTDVYMWHKWAADSRMKFAQTGLPSALHFQSLIRSMSNTQNRLNELSYWKEKAVTINDVKQLQAQIAYSEYFERTIVPATPPGLRVLEQVLEHHHFSVASAGSSYLQTLLTQAQYQALSLIWAQARGEFKSDELCKRWQNLLSDNTQCLETRLMLILALIQADQQAVTQDVIAETPGDATAIIDLMRWIRTRKQLHPWVNTHLINAFALRNPTAELHVQLAEEYMMAGMDKGCQQMLGKALEMEQNCTPALLALGTFEIKQNRYQKAEQHFQRITENQPQHALAWMLYGQSLLQQGKTEQALSALDKTDELDLIRPDRYALHAVSAWRCKEQVKAQQLLQKGFQAYPDNKELQWAYQQCR